MDKALQQLLESQGLNEDIKNALVESWEKKVSEVKVQLEEQVRGELGKRYESDKAELVEAMEKFLKEHITREAQLFNDTKKNLTIEASKAKRIFESKTKRLKKTVMETLQKELEVTAQERSKMIEDRVELRKKINEVKTVLVKENTDNMAKLTSYVSAAVKKELAEFAQDKKALAEEKIKIHKDLRESRLSYKEAFTNKIQMLEKFVLKQLHEEISEFAQDKKLLETRRVELETNASKVLAETQKAFIKRAAALIEAKISKTARTEMQQLKEDLVVARQNNFGRRIFESFATEYMTSYLAEGSEVRKLQLRLDEAKKEINATKKILTERDNEINNVKRKVKLAEERADRSKILSDMLSPLPKDQKAVMSKLLEGVKTEKLQESFNRYITKVVNQGNVKVDTGRKQLSESVQANKVVVTGNKPNRLVNVQTEEKDDQNIIELRTLAGLK